jgi:hypothetical protein
MTPPLHCAKTSKAMSRTSDYLTNIKFLYIFYERNDKKKGMISLLFVLVNGNEFIRRETTEAEYKRYLE